MTSIPAPQAAIDDDLETELLPLRRRRRLSVVTAVLLLAVVAGGAFVGGVAIQKHYGGTSSSGSGLGSAAAARRASAVGGVGSGFTAGQITLIKGTTLYVTDTSGNTVKVAAGNAQVTKTQTKAVKLSALSPGDTVVVRGTQRQDGSYTASTITLGGAGGGGGGFGGFRGGGGSGSGSGAPTGFGFGGGNG